MKWQVVLWMVYVNLGQGIQLIGKTYFESLPETSCIEYPLTMDNNEIGRLYNEGWNSFKPIIRKVITKRSTLMLGEKSVSDRMDHIDDNFIPMSDNLFKEHAKLVQDINSLRQAVFIVPFTEETKDYDDSIFHEIIETTSTTTSSTPLISSEYAASSVRYPVTSTRFPAIPSRQLLSTTKAPIISMKPFMTMKPSSIPVILLGGASQRQIVKSQPLTFAKPTISLVGTSVSPLSKHPYPFVFQSTTPRIPPVKICMKTISTMITPKQPSLWERLLNFIIPSQTLGR